jgi:membrane dipeptidase
VKRVLKTVALVIVAAFLVAALVVPGYVERSMNINLPHQPYAVSDNARSLHGTLFVADLHSDSLLWNRDLLERSSTGHMDLPRLREGNVALQVFSATTKSPAGQNYEHNEATSDNITLLAIAQLWPLRTWSSTYERAVYQLQKLQRIAEHSELVLVTSPQGLRQVVAMRERGEPAIAAIYLIEGAHALEGRLENLDALFAQGLRIVGLTHFFDNELGGSLHGISRAGLTDFGRSVVRRANELGLIIDVAHASPQMAAEVLDLSVSPVILSHGGVKGVCNTPRNFDDSLMQAIASQGGLVGIGYWDAAVCDITPQGVVRAIRYAIDLLGVDHVALGSDYDGTTAVTFDTSELAVLTDAMLRANFTEQEIRAVMGENVKRFLLENLPD